jgi:hypothetical protein
MLSFKSLVARILSGGRSALRALTIATGVL